MIDVPVQVKDALREGDRPKNFRFVVYQADAETVDFTIDNNKLISESVHIDERMCSDSEIKFGLCEGTELEFQVFDIPNITGRRINAFVDVQYVDDGVIKWFTIPLGWFDVQETSRQASTGIMKILAYNKLKSDYLDTKANEMLQDAYTSDYVVTLHDIKQTMLGEYQMQEDRTPISTDIATQTTDSLGRVLPVSVVRRYGVDTPLNGKRYMPTGTQDDDTQIYVQTNDLVYTNVNNLLDTTAIVANYGKLSGLENKIVEFFKNLINGAELSGTWQTVINAICSGNAADFNGFQDFFSVSIEYSNHNIETFSTVQYNYDIANGRTPTVDGRIADIENRMFYVGGLYPAKVTIRYVDAIGVYLPELLEPYWFFGLGNGADLTKTYEYYTDAQLHVSSSNYPLLTYSDDTPVTNADFNSRYFIHLIKYDQSKMSKSEFIGIKISEMPEFTLRDITTAIYETVCQFGKLDRITDLFSGVELNNNRLLPADSLFPTDELYPNSTSERSNRAMYSKLWADEGNVRKFRYLIITYKGTEIDPDTQQEREVEKTLQRTVHEHGTDDYNVSSNWLFKNLLWEDADVEEYADAMVEKMRNLTWFPFEMWCAGLPYIETGDEVEINMGDEAYTSYVLRRSLKGIQNLQDEMINGTLDIF